MIPHDDIPPPAYRIGFLLVDGFALMSYASVAEPFRAANLLAGREIYSVMNFSVTGQAAISSGNAIVPADGSFDQMPGLDMALVIAGGDLSVAVKAPLGAILRRLDQNGTLLGGVSGGPMLLASAGVMTGRRMTIHWEHLPLLKERFPHLLIERSLYVIDRDRVTCAGGTAPLDLTHALIAKQHGTQFAREVSDWFLHTEVRPAQGAQRSGLMEHYGTNKPAVLDAISLMQDHLADPLRLDQLATLTGLSVRQLSRLFQAELGKSPKLFYLHLRLEHARHLLLNSTLRHTEIAYATGFSSSGHFSTAYRNKYGLPPSKAFQV